MKNKKEYFLEGKKVVVLGGTSGIGLAVAHAASAEGAEIIVVSSNQHRVDLALKELPAGASGYVVDLTDENKIKELFLSIGQFDHLVFTAGENIQLGKLNDTPVEDARAYFNVRYWGALTAVKYGAPNISIGGSILLTGGIASPRPNSGWSLGASICAAMEGFTRAMAIELAPIRVNLVSPGVVQTNLWAGMQEEDRDAMYRQVSDSLPVKRVGKAEDIALTFLYLMQQQFVTGQVLVTDGGAVLV